MTIATTHTDWKTFAKRLYPRSLAEPQIQPKGGGDGQFPLKMVGAEGARKLK